MKTEIKKLYNKLVMEERCEMGEDEKKRVQIIVKKEEELLKKIKEDMEIFNICKEIQEIEQEISSLFSEQSFIKGFEMGIKIALEVLI